MPRKKNFVDPSKYGVLIPYSDFSKLVEIVENYGEMEARCERMEKMYQALKSQFNECLFRLKELDRQLQD